MENDLFFVRAMVKITGAKAIAKTFLGDLP